MISLTEWAVKWGVPPEALRELAAVSHEMDGSKHTSESAVQANVRLKATSHHIHAWRNNVGAGWVRGSPHNSGEASFMRWGLANDSKLLNAKLKSADLIGIKPRLILPSDVGSILGQFWSRECKPAKWRYTGTEREVAQLRWVTLINASGGDAAFTTGEI